MLPEGMSRQHGKIRLWPYQRGIADAISNPEIERVTVVKSARLGYTTLLTGMIASYVANDPAQILVVLPTDDDCRDYVVSEVEPVFAASPTLRGRLSHDGQAQKRNTITSRRFPGGSIKFVGANAPRNLRRHNVRVLIIDEAAAMDAASEAGSVVSRAITRTKGFDDRKIIMGSTPLDETSNVLLSYATSDRARFEVPCPSCGTFAFIEWRHIEWQPNRPDTAGFRCPSCHELIEERHKPSMIGNGRWIARNPEVRDHAGFLINALVSPLPNASWARLVGEFLAAKDDPDLLKPFVNETLAEAWHGDASDVDDDVLRRSAEPIGLNVPTEDGEPRPIPADVLAVTVGTDVQDDRLELSVVGWSPTQAFVLEHRVIWGSPDDEETWRQHDDVANARWTHPLGGALKVDAAVVDSGDGDWTETVYRYCFPRARRRIMAGKGVGGSRPAIQASQGNVKGGRLWIIGVDGLKNTIMNRLERGGSIRFADSLSETYFEQLVSEHKVKKRIRGQFRSVWDPLPGRRHEALDCLVYAFAARAALQLNFEHRRAEMAGEPVPRSEARTPREQAELFRTGRIAALTPAVPPSAPPTSLTAPIPPPSSPPAPANSPTLPRPSNPREQAEYFRTGEVRGIPAAPWHPVILAREEAARIAAIAQQKAFVDATAPDDKP